MLRVDIIGTWFQSQHKLIQHRKSLNFMNQTLINPQRTARCKSLFLVDSDGSLSGGNYRKDSQKWIKIIKKLNNSRYEGGYLEQLHKLSRYLPQYLHLDIDNYNNTYRNISVSIQELHRQLPFLECSEHEYDAQTTKTCLSKLRSKRSRPFNIAFVGDSHARYLMTQLLQNLDNTLEITKSGKKNLDILYTKPIKHYWNLELLQLNTSFFWLPYVSREEHDLYSFETFCQAYDKYSGNHHLQDLIIVSSAAWYAIVKGGVDLFVSNVKHLKKCLKFLSARIPVLWLITGTATDTFFTEMDMLATLTYRMMQDTNVWVWDSPALFAMREKSTLCSQLVTDKTTGDLLSVPQEWRCYEAVHGGRFFNIRAVNMIWNLVCNRIMNVNDTHCCR